MGAIRAIVSKYRLLCFYLIAFAFSWGGVLLVIGGPARIPGSPAETQALIGPVMLAWFAGPSIASLVVTALAEGKAGLRGLGLRLTKWRVGIHWYAIALLAGPAVDALTLLLLSLLYPGYLPKIVTSTDKLSVLLFGIVSGLVGGGFLEELGWTGFAVHNLRSRHGAFDTALIVGVLWGAVHFSFVLWASGGTIGSIPLATFVIVRMADLLLGGLPAFRVLMVWVYDRTGSLLIAMLMHATLSASMLIIAPESISGVPFIALCLLGSVTRWVIVGAVAGLHRLLRPAPMAAADAPTAA